MIFFFFCGTEETNSHKTTLELRMTKCNNNPEGEYVRTSRTGICLPVHTVRIFRGLWNRNTETPDWLFLCLVCGFVLLSISLSFSVVVWTSLNRVLWSHLWPPSLCLISCFWGNSHIILMWSQTIFLSGVLGIYESVLCLKLLFFKWISVKINQNPNIWAMTFYSSA